MKVNNKIIILLLIGLFFVLNTTVESKYILNTSKVVFNLNIDREPPKIYGVENEEKYDKSKTITYSDNRGIAKAEYEYSETKKWTGNTNELKNGTIFEDTGYYKIIVTDTSGNSTQTIFFIGVPLITEWTVSNNTKIKLPIENNNSSGYQYDFKVDWGDGTKQKLYASKEITHTYKEYGTYQVKVLGICENWSFKEYAENYSQYLTKIVQWGEISAKHYDFKNCTNLAGNIPIPTKGSFKSIISFDSLFYNCYNLTGNIPNNLFQNAKNNKNFLQNYDDIPKNWILRI